MTTRTSDRPARPAYDATSPEIAAWRGNNPVKLWLATQPHGTGKKLAKSFGVSTAAFYYWLNGRSLPPADQLLELCDRSRVGFRHYVEWWKSYPG